jgi:hypothetical protein
MDIFDIFLIRYFNLELRLLAGRLEEDLTFCLSALSSEDRGLCSLLKKSLAWDHFQIRYHMICLS